MSGCDCESNAKFDGVSPSYKRVLWIVIAINIFMFVVEIVAGMKADSMALQADALDFLGDSLTYTISLLVIGHALKWRTYAALFKGATLAMMGLWVLGSTVYRMFILGQPDEFIMGGVAMMAFVANMISAVLLMRFRDGDANVRSVWLCSRNDAIGNLAVMLSAGLVLVTQSAWPDLIVAALMSSLFLHSAYLIIRQALNEKASVEESESCQITAQTND